VTIGVLDLWPCQAGQCVLVQLTEHESPP